MTLRSPWCEQSWVDDMKPGKQTLLPRFLQWSERASLRLCCRAHSGDDHDDIEALCWDLLVKVLFLKGFERTAHHENNDSDDNDDHIKNGHYTAHRAVVRSVSSY